MVIKKYLIENNRIVVGYHFDEHSLAYEAYELINGNWVKIDRNEINDRLMGYDPSEVLGYRTFNIDIMDEIKEVDENEFRELLKSNLSYMLECK